MNEIVRSRNAMLLASLGAVLGALAEVLGLIAFAVLNINNDTTYLDLGHAHDWVFFGGSLLVLGAVGLVAWERIAQSSGAGTSAGPATLELIERATLRERPVFEFPALGEPYWDEQTLADTQARYPRAVDRPRSVMR